MFIPFLFMPRRECDSVMVPFKFPQWVLILIEGNSSHLLHCPHFFIAFRKKNASLKNLYTPPKLAL